MRARNQVARDRLPSLLRRLGPTAAPVLARDLGVSLPTIHRMLQELGPDATVKAGSTGRARHALRRPLRGDLSLLPVYAIDESGAASQLASLALIAPAGSWCPLPGTDWPAPDESRDGWWPGLPYPLYDMRPQGYMGRQLARAEAARLQVAENPASWSDDDIAYVLGQCGIDVSGNLIVGDPALRRWHQTRLDGLSPLPGNEVGPAYVRLAEQAVAMGVPGSSAAGEFPKFAAIRDLADSRTPHVLVKFSGSDDSPAVRRWSDLLVCEHLALETIREALHLRTGDADKTHVGDAFAKIATASSRIVQYGGRTFLEVERFDRIEAFGRRSLCSLETVNAALIGGASSDWTVLADRLEAARLLTTADRERIARLWWFGRLIANTDMHLGNLSFRPHASMFALEPAYDMVPMLYAPLPGGELPDRRFAPPLPLPNQRPAWLAASVAALRFWERAADDSRISAPMRAICGTNAAALREMGHTHF